MQRLLSLPALSFLVSLAMGALACGPGGGGDDADGGPSSCTGNETRCDGATYQICDNGTFRDTVTCASTCDPGLGCVECRPAWGTVCQGDAVHTCAADGTIGNAVETCDPGTCSNGACADNGCVAAAELIYVVDRQYRLLSFDPRKLDMGQDPFTLIGPLDCPTVASSYSGWNNPPTPFSMSVDRNATAWVLYSNGELFHVSTDDASCQATTFARGQQNFQLFGMGFVSESPGSVDERLWIAGGPTSNGSLDIGNLGYIDPGTLQVSNVGPLPDNGTYSPELTGTGDALLFGYYPSTNTPSIVARVQKESGNHDPAMTWDLPALGGGVRAWAFAHWGGNFYIFVTTQEGGGDNSQVLYFNRTTEQVTTKLEWQNYFIVGAGVSTCAPIVVE